MSLTAVNHGSHVHLKTQRSLARWGQNHHVLCVFQITLSISIVLQSASCFVNYG